MIETNGGATTSFGYLIHVIEKGGKMPDKASADLYGAIRSNVAYGVNLRWKSESQLTVEYLSAQFANNHGPAALQGFEPVAIELRDGVVDPAAPRGGMLYNLSIRVSPEEMQQPRRP